MKNDIFSRVCCAVLLIALGAMVLSMDASVGIGGPQLGPCGPCVSEFITQAQLDSPNGECEHGPEWDSDCYTIVNGKKVIIKPCCEVGFGGPGCTGAAGECACGTCNSAHGCEDMMEHWMTWCGTYGSGQCFGASEPDPTKPNEVNFRSRRRKPSNATAGCGFTGGAFTVEPCGTDTHGLACKANAGTCDWDGDWVDDSKGQLTRCKTGT